MEGVSNVLLVSTCDYLGQTKLISGVSDVVSGFLHPRFPIDKILVSILQIPENI